METFRPKPKRTKRRLEVTLPLRATRMREGKSYPTR